MGMRKKVEGEVFGRIEGEDVKERKVEKRKINEMGERDGRKGKKRKEGKANGKEREKEKGRKRE
jgi:hypothetical protein